MRTQDRVTQWIIHAIMIILSCMCIFPFLLLIISSITDEKSIIHYGYSFFPREISFSAYQYLVKDSAKMLRALGITVVVTVVGTAVSLLITALLAYPLSRKDMPLSNPLSFLVFITMLFNGGLVPTYLVYTQFLHMKNTIWALIVPGLLLNAFYVMLMRTFFSNSIPGAIIESAKIDGASEFRIFCQMVLPLSLPVLATVGLFQTIHYWNDWYNGLIYLTDSKLYSLQNLLNRILMDIEFLKRADSSYGAQDTTSIPTETARMAMAVLGIIPIILTYPFFQKFFVKGLTIGAVKG
ncbi:carbohydrate ABC transporter permease [Paenibacillus hamazuiensis]|uniref:carbohydrate ABC transporter permease n=1 Tax=Paenibacillus hamazuiensis TaxID=2936508 RepID=UPI00200D6A1C